MGKRKSRFAAKKNYERKKWPTPLLVSIPLESIKPPSLVVSLPVSAYTSSEVGNPSLLQSRLERSCLLPSDWRFGDEHTSALQLSSLSLILHKVPVFGASAGIVYTLVITQNLMWELRLGESIISQGIELLRDFSPAIATVNQVLELLTCLDEAGVCAGNDDSKFLELAATHKGSFKDASGTHIIARFDSRPLPWPTIWHSKCEFLVSSGTSRCANCSEYRHILLTMSRRASVGKSTEKTATSSHTNYRYLSTPEKHKRMKSLHRESRVVHMRLQRMEVRLRKAIEDKGVCLDTEVTDDLRHVMESEDDRVMRDIEPGSFRHLFWKQQKEAATRDKRGMRWHPAMIKWCLYLRHQSSQAYKTLRDSGCIHLPSQRTLRDYTHCVKSQTGFSAAVDKQLMGAANLPSCRSWERLVILLLDEMYVREDLVYVKRTGKLVGFTSLGDVNDHLIAFERSLSEETSDDVCEVAKTMIVFMVRGLFTRLRFPYAQIACQSVTGELLYHPFWHAVSRLERMEFKVLAATCDGASTNRRLVKVHDLKAKFIYKVQNVYAKDKRELFFFSDPPHLIKTTRNCWSSSARSLWNNGCDISWSHLVTLFERDAGKASGLSMIPKLTYEHVHLTSFSKMRVDLAAQVLSESVSKALPLVVGVEAKETARFAEIMDKFFDALNVSNFHNGRRHRKPFCHPYRNGDDERLKWLKETFLGYFDEWEKCVKKRAGFDNNERKRMLLSSETLLGLRMTANSFIELVKYLFSLPEVKENKLAFLSQNICQDPLEVFFGCQRQRGGTSDNPNVHEFLQNTEALRVVDSFCRGPNTGNCRGVGSKRSRNTVLTEHDCLPLPRRKRTCTL